MEDFQMDGRIYVAIIVVALIALIIGGIVFAVISYFKRERNDDGTKEGMRSLLSGRAARLRPGDKAPLIGFMPEGFAGVVYRFGRIKDRMVRPGFYVRLPLFTVIIAVSVQDDVVDVPAQTVLIESGASMQIDTALTIRAVNPALALKEVYDYKSQIREVAMQVAASAMKGLKLDDIVSGKRADETLESQLHDALEPYGVSVIRFSVVSYKLSDSLQDATEQVIKARLDADAAIVHVERENEVAKKLVAAAERYAEKSDSKLSIGEVALRLRELSTYEDLANPSVLLSGQ